MRRLLMVAALVAAVSEPLTAQRLGPPEDRPRLRDVTDTNDAQAYFARGIAAFENDPDGAAAAFYWSARINPASGEALYGRRAALLMKDHGLRSQMLNGYRKPSPEMRRLDSLQFRALMLNPFLYRRFDRTMIVSVIREDVMRRSRQSGGGEPGRIEVDDMIENYLRSGGNDMRAWMAYGSGDFERALRMYDAALGASRNPSYIRMERARIFGMRGQVDSAVAEFNRAIEAQQKDDQKELVVFYDSKAQAEFSIGMLLEGQGDAKGAREAYGRALQEDLSYYPAHLRLGLLALSLQDTTTAASELALASQLAVDEPHVHYVHGYVLTAMRHYAEAVVELKKAVELEPYYALPYLTLGHTYEQLMKGPEALAAYQGFLDHASQMDVQRPRAQERLAEVKEYIESIQTAKP
jgi:tetratricopeptide (TPR) repeat protein